MNLKRILLILIICMITIFPLAAFAEQEEAKIADVKLKSALRKMVDKSQSDDLYVTDLGDITGQVDLSNLEIVDASGIKYLVNASSIDLSHNKIQTMRGDFSKLTKLTELDLSFNGMYNKVEVYLDDIPNLYSLNLAGNKFTIFPNIFAKLKTLDEIDISANRMEVFPIELSTMAVTSLKCNYNFFDISQGSENRIKMEELAMNIDVDGAKQLIKLPAVSYKTIDGNLVAIWQELSNITFYDDSQAKIVGYSILVDGNYVKRVTYDKESAVLADIDSSKQHSISIGPDYNIEEYGDHKIKAYTLFENASVGSKGPELAENDTPITYENFCEKPEETPQPEPTEEVIEAPEEVVETTTEVETPEPVEEEKPSKITLPLILLVIIILLIAVIAYLLISLLKNKHIKGKEDYDVVETDSLVDDIDDFEHRI